MITLTPGMVVVMPPDPDAPNGYTVRALTEDEQREIVRRIREVIK